MAAVEMPLGFILGSFKGRFMSLCHSGLLSSKRSESTFPPRSIE
jgi:hypothetical protein